MKTKLTKPFQKAMQQARIVAQSRNDKLEIHRLCALLIGAINHG